MTKILENSPQRVVVSLSPRRWKRLMELEQTYKLARTIKRSMTQVETAPVMTSQEAIEYLRAL